MEKREFDLAALTEWERHMRAVDDGPFTTDFDKLIQRDAFARPCQRLVHVSAFQDPKAADMFLGLKSAREHRVSGLASAEFVEAC